MAISAKTPRVLAHLADLADNPGSTAEELAARAALHPNRLREALCLARDAGWVYSTPIPRVQGAAGGNRWWLTEEGEEQALDKPFSHRKCAVGEWKLDHPVSFNSIFSLAGTDRVYS